MSSSELPPRYNFSAYQGDRKDREFAFFERIWDPDANAGEGAWVKGPPRTLPTDIKAEIRTEEGALVGEFVVFVYDQTGADKGRLRISLLPALSGTLAEGSYLYDIEATPGPDDIETLLRGKVKITSDVTD